MFLHLRLRAKKEKIIIYWTYWGVMLEEEPGIADRAEDVGTKVEWISVWAVWKVGTYRF